MATIAEILEAMADTVRESLEDVLGGDLGIQVEPRYVPNPSALVVDIYPGDPFGSRIAAGFGGLVGQWQITVRARSNTPDNDTAQDLLLALMDDEDPLSVAGALYENDTLDGLVSSMLIEGPSGYAQYIDPGQQGALLGTEWRVTVIKATS